MAYVNKDGFDKLWQNQGAMNTPLANPVKSLYGFDPFVDPLINGHQYDLEDFSKDVTNKKEMFPVSLTGQEILESIGKGNLSPSIEGSIFQEKNWNDMLIALKEHYGRVAVPGGFDWAIRLVNIKPVLKTMNLWDKLPEDVTASWDWAILIAFALVYEGWGLGGLDTKVLEWHFVMKCVASNASFEVDSLEHFQDEYVENQLHGGTDKDFALKIFKLIFPQKVGVQWKDESFLEAIFQILLFSATCRGIVSKLKKNKPLSKYQEDYEALGLSNEEIIFLSLCGQVLRDGAKGAMDMTELPLGYQLEAHPLWKLAFLPGIKDKAQGAKIISVADTALLWAVKMKDLGVARKNEIQNSF